MGFLTSFSRSMYLTNYINTLQIQLDDITSEQIALSNTVSQLQSQISEINDNDSAAVKQLFARKTELEALDKQLSQRLEKIKHQLQAANTEKQSADQMLQLNIQRSFTYMGGR